MLIRYVREFPKFDESGKIVSRGNPIGCVVALDADHIGYTICNPCDPFKKEYARNLAAGRALTNTRPKVPKRVVDHFIDWDNRQEVTVMLKEELADIISYMQEKANSKGLKV